MLTKLLPDGKLYFDENGEVMKTFNGKGGCSIAHMLPEMMDIIPIIISAGSQE